VVCVKGFRVVFVSTVVGGLSGTVLAALGEMVGTELVVGMVECGIDGTVVYALDDGMVMCAVEDGTVMYVLDDGTVICVHDDALFLLFLKVDFVDMFCTGEVSAVVGDMIQRLLTRLPVMAIDGDDIEPLLRPNMDVYPAVSN
jgi:hypothetical protein